MPYFNYGYFDYNKKKVKKYNNNNKRISKKRTIINRIIANKFDHDFYDGKRINGYGGFKYDGRWKAFLKKIIKRYNLNKNSKVLDIGSKKGFFIHDLKEMVPGIKVYGVEDHKYAIKKTMPKVKRYVKYVKSYCDINYKKSYFDFVHAHNAIYRYSLKDIINIIRIISKISKKSHITIPSYEKEIERKIFYQWTLSGGSIFKKSEWKLMFKYLNYKGDYYFSGTKSFGL